MRLLVATSAAACVFAVLTGMLTVAPNLLARGEHGTLLRVAASGGKQGLLELAWARMQADQEGEALVFARLATELDRRDHHSPALVSLLLALGGECEAADRAFELAVSRTTSARQEERCGWIARARDQLPLCQAVTAHVDTAERRE